MTLPPELLKHKTLMLAVLYMARQITDALGVKIDAPLAEVCRATAANRTSIYEQARRLLSALTQLATAKPGRPEATRTANPPLNHASLTIAVLEYRIHHPGAIVEHEARTTYAPQFQRFILEHHDRWTGTLEDFAKATRIPLDTLRDWLRQDREQLATDTKKRPPVPCNPSETTRQIVDEWERWIGPTRAFIGHAAKYFDISPAQVTRVLKILGIISARPRRSPFRYRGTTHPLCPGTMLVTDGKWITVRLLDSQEDLYFNWQGTVDQTTGCHTAVVISQQEDANAVHQAYDRSVEFLAGVAPDALLHDNKPCYDDDKLRQTINNCGTDMIHATPARPENKAVLEGAFGRWEQRVGTLKLDDTDNETLISSAVEEIVRAYTAALNTVPRDEWNGRSRMQVLQLVCPTMEQRQRDHDFLARLKARQQAQRRGRQPDPDIRQFLDQIFERLDLLPNDPKGSLRRYLATYFQHEAIRRATAIVAAKLDNGTIDRSSAHRYLAKVIRSQQDELDLEKEAAELLELCKLQNQNWTHREEQHFDQLSADHNDQIELARAVAECAAHGGVPLQGIFWTRKLLELLKHATHLVDAVKCHLIRLYEAPKQQRLALLDQIIAQELALA
ncbi:MAG: transposase family protein [bacterium]|nr:transposase family protein [bacterium]